MAPIKTVEKARLIVEGHQFEDWTSVWVQRTWGNPYDQFKFSCAEREGASASDVRSSMKFIPGHECRIELAGQLAITGYIITRQAAYDANSHAVQLAGTNQTWAPATSGIEHKTNSFDNKTFDEIAKEVLGPHGGSRIIRWKGKPPQNVFKYCHSEKGETIFDFLQRIARNVNVVVTCDEEGKFLFVGESPDKSGSGGQLIEGVNILKMQAVISQQQGFKRYIIHGSSNANDKLKYREAAEQKATLDPKRTAELRFYRVKVIPMEQPTTEQETVDKRAETEAMWDAGTEVNATVEVQGWQPGGGIGGNNDLWEPGNTVAVKSPMAMLDQEMSIQSVTYTQDNASGSKTTLVLVNPWALLSPKYAIGSR